MRYALRHQRATEVVPRRVRARLGVEPARHHHWVVAQCLEQDVVGPETAGGPQRQVGRLVCSLVVAGPPLRLGEVDGGGRQLEHPVAEHHALHRSTKPSALWIRPSGPSCSPPRAVARVRTTCQPARTPRGMDTPRDGAPPGRALRAPSTDRARGAAPTWHPEERSETRARGSRSTWPVFARARPHLAPRSRGRRRSAPPVPPTPQAGLRPVLLREPARRAPRSSAVRPIARRAATRRAPEMASIHRDELSPRTRSSRP